MFASKDLEVLAQNIINKGMMKVNSPPRRGSNKLLKQLVRKARSMRR